MLWTSVYQPSSFDDCLIHKKSTRIIRSFVTNKDGSKLAQSTIEEMPHILVYGGMGGGKTTRVNCLLTALYGDSIWKQRKKESHIIDVGEKKVDIDIYQSKHHIELDAIKLGTKDKTIIQHFIKEKARLLSTTSAGRETMMSMLISKIPFMKQGCNDLMIKTHVPKFSVVVIDHADRLSLGAQQGLRRTMEVYGKSCKIILVASSNDAIIPALLSRVASVRVPLASNESIVRILNHILVDFNKREKDNERYNDLFRSIVAHSGGNIKKAILTAQRAIMSDDHTTITYTLDSVINKRIMNVLCLRPNPSTLSSLRNTIADILISSVSHKEVIASVTKVGGNIIHNKNKNETVTIKWINVSMQASEYFGKGGDPLCVLEYMFAGFIDLIK